jgi:DNA replication protein DnaC
MRVRAILPDRYWGARLSDFSPEVAEPVQRWLALPGDGLFVSGPAGTGKTHLAAALVRAAADARQQVTFLRCSDFYREIRRSFTSELSAEDVESRYQQEPLLVLDDMAAGSLSDFERREMLNLLDIRLNSLRPTVVTSNLGLEQIALQMDERIASRMRSFVPIVLGGRDRRRK